MSDRVDLIITKAVDLANQNSHEYVTLEHLATAMFVDEDIKNLVKIAKYASATRSKTAKANGSPNYFLTWIFYADYPLFYQRQNRGSLGVCVLNALHFLRLEHCNCVWRRRANF